MGSRVSSGTVVAGFRVERLLGEGAMGAVYVAAEVGNGQRVALKLLPRSSRETIASGSASFESPASPPALTTRTS